MFIVSPHFVTGKLHAGKAETIAEPVAYNFMMASAARAMHGALPSDHLPRYF
jgi:hypothetical protein